LRCAAGFPGAPWSGRCRFRWLGPVVAARLPVVLAGPFGGWGLSCGRVCLPLLLGRCGGSWVAAWSVVALGRALVGGLLALVLGVAVGAGSCSAGVVALAAAVPPVALAGSPALAPVAPAMAFVLKNTCTIFDQKHSNILKY